MEYVKIFSAVPMLMPMLTTESLDDGKEKKDFVSRSALFGSFACRGC